MEEDETLLDKLFEIRCEEFNATFAEEHKKQMELNQTLEKKEDLYETIKKAFDFSEEKLLKILEAINEYEGAFISEVDFMSKKYYKLGFSDAQDLKKECKEIGEQNGKVI